MSVNAPPRKKAAAADPQAREFLRKADPVLAELIDARPEFRPRAWMDELPPLDAFGTLVFQVAGQQLSVASTRAIISHLEDRFGGHMPSAAELLAADPQVLRDSGFSARKGQTLRALAERFVDGRLSEEALSRMTDDEVEANLTEVSGIGRGRRAWLPARRSRPARRLLLRRPRAPTRDPRAYGFDHLPTEEETAEVSDRWRPYRSLAVSYLFASEYDGQP
jgi:DNA-3-methyladenine glycosylase II